MKNGRKIISIILTICMVMQILPVFATEGVAQTPVAGGAGGTGINYLINDDFGATDLSGWELIGDNGFEDYPTDTFTTTPIEGEDGNYALKYLVGKGTWEKTHISRALDTPVTFAEGTDVVIETRMRQSSGRVVKEDGTLDTSSAAGYGRSFLKYNFAWTATAEYNFDWGTLVRNNKGELHGINGWTATTDETYGTYYNYPATNALNSVGAEEWYNVKVVISRTAEGKNVADYIITKDDGSLIGEAYDKSIDFPENSSWRQGTQSYATEDDGVAWVENALNTVDFRQRIDSDAPTEASNTLYVDYVRVYEAKQESVQANLVNGRYVQFDENIEVKLTTDAEKITLIEKTAKLTTAAGEEVAASVSYDAENKILSVKPTQDLTPGSIYNLTFTDNEFNAFTGTKAFELEARAARSYGVVVNDTFDDLQLGVTDNASGWYLSSNVDAAYKGSIEIAEEKGATGKVLKVTGKMDGGTVANNKQTYLTKKIGGGIEYKEGTEVIIRTRVKHTNNAARMVMVANRPDSSILATNALGANLYNLFVANTNSGVDVYNGTAGGGTQGGSSKLASGVDLSNVWLDVELTIDGYNQEMDAVVKAYDEAGTTVVGTYPASDLKLVRTASVFENHYGIGTAKAAFDALERLGFTFRNSSTDDTLYIDYIEVYEVYDNVKVSVDETYKPGEAIDVTFDVAGGDDSFKDAVELYNGDAEITAVSKSINEAKNVVTITPDEALTEGAYKVVVDTTNVPAEAYTIKNTTATFHVMDKEYLIYDEFGKDDAEGWEDKEYADKATTNVMTVTTDENDSTNYVLKYTSDSDANAYGGYITKALPMPAEFEDGKNVVIETKIRQNADTGRSFLKYNLHGATAYTTNEWNYQWGTLIHNNAGNIQFVKGWTAKTSDDAAYYTYPTGMDYFTTGYDNNFAAGAAGDWFTYKVVIHTSTDGAANKASYYIYDKSGTEVAKYENASIDFPDNAVWGSATGSQGPDWAEDVLNSVDFRIRNVTTLEIDYVKVWEYTSADVRVNTVEGKTFEAGKAIEFNVTAADGATVSDAIVDTVTVSTDADVAYENGILKVTPENAAEGDTITVSFEDNDYVKYVDSTTEFTLTARGERETGVIINDTFDGEDAATTLDGWVAGAMADGNATKLDVNTYEGRKALRFYTETADVTHTSSVGIQPKIYKKLGNGVEFTGNNKVIIKTAVFQPTTSTGRFDFKFNRPDSITQIAKLNENQWFNYGLIRHNSSKASVTSSINDEHASGAYVEPIDFKNGSTVLNPMGQWVEYTLVLDGYAKEISATAVDAKGVIYTAKGLFDLAAVTYEDIYGKGIVTKNNRDNAYVKALESLTFKNTEGDSKPVYIDYIKVYEDSAVVDVDVRSTARYDKGFTIKLDTKSDISELGTVATVEGVETTQSINNDNKVVTLIPEENLVLNQVYTLNLNADVLADAGLLYEGKTTFTVKARDNIIFDNQFKTAGDSEGWVLGETTVDSSKYEYGVADDAMYLTLKEGRDDPDTPALYLDFADVDYEEGSTIIIETKIMQTGTTTDHRSLLKLNRPNITSFSGNENGRNWYGLVALRGTQFDATRSSDHSGMDPMFTAADAGVENLANKWVDVKIELDGANQVAYITATPDGGKPYTATSTLADEASALADAGAPETGFTALDSLTWLFRSNAGENTLYIDYIKAYEKVNASVTIDAAAMPGYDVKIKGNADIGAYITTGDVILENLETYVDLYDGENVVVDATKTHIEGTNKVVIDPTSDLAAGAYTVKFDKDALAAKGYTIEGETEFDVNVIEGADVDLSFEDATAGTFTDSTWAFEESTLTQKADIVEESGNKFLRITADGETAAAAGKVLTYSKTLATPFVRDMKASTVFEAKIRTNSDAMRKQIKLNYPNDGTTNTNVYNEVGWNTRIAAVMNKGDLSVTYDDFRPDDQRQGKATNVAEYELEQWYTIKTIYHNAEGTASTYVYDEEGTLIGELEDKALTAWWFNYYDYLETQPQVMHSIDDITIRFRPNASGTVASEQFDIDDIKLYNITEVAESATAKFMNGEDEVAAIVESGNVTPTFTIQSKDNAETDYYVIAAKYDDGRLVSTQMKKVTVAGTQTVTLDAIAVDHTDTGLVVKAFVWNKDMVPVCGAAEIKPTVYTIYMSANGNDANEGYESTPVATLNRAVELANDAKTKGYSTSEVIVADGNYELTGETISIGSNLKADSLTVRGENDGDDEKAEFINGIAFKIGDATKVNDEDVLGKLVHHSNYETIADNLYAIDIKNLIPEGTEIPEMNLPGTYSYYCDGYSYGTDGVFDITEPELSPNELFYKGETMTVARYPDGNYASLGTVTTDKAKYDAGEFNAYYDKQSVTRNWMEDKNTGASDSTYIAVANRTVTPFEVKLAQSANWAGADQAIAFGFWMHDWATQSTPVSFADGVMTSKYPSHYGLANNARFYVYNLLEEISSPGEYFIDRDKTSETYGMLYFYKPAGATEDDEITMSLYGSEDVGIIDITANNVTIKDLVFTASRGKAIRIAGENIIVDGCEISGTAHGAVSFSGSARNSVIQNCVIKDVNGGISLGGGSTDTLTPGGNKVLNNTITNFSRLNKTYTDAIHVSGMGNTASYNVISEGEHLAIRLSGVDNEVSYNDISKVLKEADDMGAIYHGRSWTSRDNKIKFNFIHDLGSTAVGAGDSAIGGIFLDDHTADFEVYGNIFYDIDGHGVRLNKGREHKINNNIFGKLKYPVNGSEASGNAGDYTTQINGVKALLKNDAWKNSKYASELFNESKTDYNPDLLWSKGLEFKNNFTAASESYTVNGTWSYFTIEGNGSLTEMPTTKAAITSSVADKGGTFDFTGFDANFLKAIGITE